MVEKPLKQIENGWEHENDWAWQCTIAKIFKLVANKCCPFFMHVYRCGCGRIRSDHLYLNKRAIGVDELPLGASACNFSQVKIVKTDILTTGLKKIETTSNLHEPNW